MKHDEQIIVPKYKKNKIFNIFKFFLVLIFLIVAWLIGREIGIRQANASLTQKTNITIEDSSKAAYDELNNKNDELRNKNDELRKKIDELNNEIDQIQTDKRELKNSNTELLTENQSLQEQLESLKEQEVNSDALLTQLDSVQEEKLALETEKNKLQKLYDKAVKKVKFCEENHTTVEPNSEPNSVEKTSLFGLPILSGSSNSWFVNEKGKKDTLGGQYDEKGDYVVAGAYNWLNGRAEYVLNNNYTTLVGRIAPHYNATGEGTSSIRILDMTDGHNNKCIYNSDEVGVRTNVFSIPTLDISNVQILRIEQDGNTRVPLILTDWYVY